MEKTTHYEETTKVVTTDAHTHGTTTSGKKTKNKKNKHAKDANLGPKKSMGTKLKEFFTGRHDDGIIYQNGLPIAGLNGPIVQPMGAPIRQPAEIHPVATVANTANRTGFQGEHHNGPTTTTYGPAPPLAPGYPEGIAMTTTHTEYIHPGAQQMQPMNAVAQPTGLGAIAQPAGVIIARKDKQFGLTEGYLQDRAVKAYPKEKHSKHDKDTHHHDEVYTNTTDSYIAQPMALPAEPAPAIFTGPARVLDDKHNKHAKHDKHDKHDKHSTHGTHAPVMNPAMYEQPHHMGGHQEGHIHQQPMQYQEQNFQGNLPPVNQPGYILQQPGLAPGNQPLVRNHEQVPMTSHSGLAQGGIFQNDTARPVQTFTPIVQQNQVLTEAPILNQAAQEQMTFAPAGIRTKEGLVETRGLTGQHAGTGAKYTSPAGYEERKETIVHNNVQY